MRALGSRSMPKCLSLLYHEVAIVFSAFTTTKAQFQFWSRVEALPVPSVIDCDTLPQSSIPQCCSFVCYRFAMHGATLEVMPCASYSDPCRFGFGSECVLQHQGVVVIREQSREPANTPRSALPLPSYVNAAVPSQFQVLVAHSCQLHVPASVSVSSPRPVLSPAVIIRTR